MEDRRKKLHDYCTFPLVLNMNLYAEGWERHEELKTKRTNSMEIYSEDEITDKKITKTESKIKLSNDLKKE